ncbi:MAG TPA: dihydrofolate reductase family protein [Verrucomicrobiae bacterium]|nr:dihydrofolate reductase family protein [Verrucomicrobiae bacterium]
MPFVSINMATTADGKIATANRAVHSFGSPRDLRHLYELRATADAVMCGARTVEISDSILGNGGEIFRRQRLKNGRAEYNLRIIVTGSGTINPRAKIFQHRFSPIIVLTTRRAPEKKLQQLRELAAEVKICGETDIDFRAALRWLRSKWKVKRLLCEGGGELNDALFQADLVNEINLTLCPKIFGGRTSPTIADGRGFSKLALTRQFRFASTSEFQGELFTVLSRA